MTELAGRFGPAAIEGATARLASGLIGNADHDTVVPVANRRVGPYQDGVGTVPKAGGEDWLDLDFAKPIGGAKFSPEEFQHTWDNALDKIRSWSPEQATALDDYLADHPQVGPNTWKFWNDALNQTDKERYWYERGTRKFQQEGLDAHPADFRDTMNVTAATSPSAEPLQNLQRTVGVMAEHQQGLPISTDLITPGSVRMALTTGLAAPKTSNYTQTFLHIGGVDDKPPLSVNDRQMAEIYGIKPDDLAKRPDLYVLLSQHQQNLRDAQNAGSPEIVSGQANPFETWQIQAPGWAWWRGLKDPTKAGRSDDYFDVMNTIKPQLEAAGVDTSKGLFSPEVLSHPQTPNAMSGTRALFLNAPTATIETATSMTPQGQRAADLLNRLPSGPQAPSWADKARYGLERVQRNAMTELVTGDKDSVISKLISPVIGDRNAALSRADTTGWGTYQGDINPNLRLPMWATSKGQRVGLTPEQIAPVLSAIGDAFGQEGTAASHFETVAPGADTGGRPLTYSVFVPEPTGAQTPTAQLQQFRQQLGNEISVSRAPNGTLVDVHPSFTGGAPPSRDQVVSATNAAFGQTAPDAHIYNRAYRSYYFEHPSQNPTANYDTEIGDFWKGQRDADTSGGRAGGLRKSDWTAQQRASDFEDARQQARAIAATQQQRTNDWSDQWQPRIEQWENPGATRGRRLKPLVGLAGAGALGAAGYGALDNPAQAAQPPPNFAPVDPSLTHLGSLISPGGAWR
jgi:hypothetical protein